MTIQKDAQILVVDDEPERARLFEAWLNDRWTVDTANNGRAALDIMDEHVDLVFLDRRMPGIDVNEVLEQLRDRG